MFTHLWNRERVCSMVELYSLMSISDFLALTIWPGRPWKQKECCNSLTMIVRRKEGIGTTMLHSIKNNTLYWRAFLIIVLNWKQGSMLAGPKKTAWQDFDVTVSYLHWMVMKKCYNIQSLCIAKTGSQSAKPNVVAFMGKLECKKYLKAVWNSVYKEQQMQVRKLCEQQCIKPAVKYINAGARIAALSVWCGICCHEGGSEKLCSILDPHTFKEILCWLSIIPSDWMY